MLQKAINDSIIYSGINTDSLQLVNDNLLLFQEIVHLTQQENLLLLQYNNNKAGKISSAIVLNNAVNATATIETNEQDVNDIYLSKIIGGDYLLTTAQLNTLHYVANQCPFACNVMQHGFYLGDSTWNWNSIPNHPNYFLGPVLGSVCDSLGLGIDDDIYKKNLNLRINPNPAQNSFYLNYELPSVKDATLYVYSTLGKLVFK